MPDHCPTARPAVRPVAEQLLAAWPAQVWSGVHVVLAVSGGADSMALLRAMLEAKRTANGAGQLYVAHFNHQWRGDQSEQDVQWLRDLCHRLNVPLEVGKL